MRHKIIVLAMVVLVARCALAVPYMAMPWITAQYAIEELVRPAREAAKNEIEQKAKAELAEAVKTYRVRRFERAAARRELAANTRHLRAIVAAIKKAEADIKWIGANPRYREKRTTRQRCTRCGGDGRITTKVKYGNRVTKCTSCGGDGTRETVSYVSGYRDANKTTTLLVALRKEEALSTVQRAKIEAEIERLSADGEPE